MTTHDPTAAELVDSIASGGLNALGRPAALESVDPDELRAVLVDRLLHGGALPSPGVLDKLFEIARVMDDRERLVPVMLDPARPRPLRASLALALADEFPDEWEALLDRDDLPIEDETLPIEALARHRLMAMGMNLAGPDGLALLLEQVHPEFAEDLGPRIEETRRMLQLGAGRAYGVVLERPELAPFHPTMLDAVADEGSNEAVELLERLRDNAPDDDARRTLQRAVLRARTALIEPHAAELPEGEAWVSSTDPEGSLAVFARFPQSDGSEHALTLLLGRDGRVPTGGLLLNQGPGLLQRLRAPLENSGVILFAPAPPSEAGHVVRDVLGDQLDTVPDAARSGIELMLRLADNVPRAPLPEAAEEPSVEAFSELFSQPPYGTWALDRPLADRIQRVSRDGRAPREELDQITREFEKIDAACAHMARWHRWRGEHDAARLMASVRLVEGGPGNAAFFAALAVK